MNRNVLTVAVLGRKGLATHQREGDLCFIEGGTGGYTNLRGQGTFTFVNDGPASPVDIVCTAQVHMS